MPHPANCTLEDILLAMALAACVVAAWRIHQLGAQSFSRARHCRLVSRATLPLVALLLGSHLYQAPDVAASLAARLDLVLTALIAAGLGCVAWLGGHLVIIEAATRRPPRR